MPLQSPSSPSPAAGTLTWLLPLLMVAAVSIASASPNDPYLADGAGFENVPDPAAGFFASPGVDHAAPANGPATVYRLEHDFVIPNGDRLHVVEHFTLASWQRSPRRAILLTTSFTASGYSIPVEGYDLTAMLAREGFFAFSVDLIGYAGSSKPENGNDATFARQRAALEAAIRYVRFRRHVPKVDLYGEGLGGSLTVELAADAERVRSVVVTDQIYKIQLAGPAADPAFRAFLLADEDGYIFIPPELIQIFLVTSPPEVASYFATTQSGFYPVASFTVAFDLPFYDPKPAAVPALIVQSELDFETTLADIEDLVADYGFEGGGEAQLLVVEGAPRAARFGAPVHAALLWEAVRSFLAP